MIKAKYLEVKQPVGIFFLCSIEASTLLKIAEVRQRQVNSEYIQRDESTNRISEIADFCGDADAIFPTPIIIAIDSEADVKIDDEFIHFNESEIIGEVIDGQHRLLGLGKSGKSEAFQLPVVFMFDLESYDKAYVFSIINSKQTRVSTSLIYDLYALSDKRSPFKTCNEIARALNKDPQSPFFNRMKMLGKKNNSQVDASITQGAFIKSTLELISRHPDEDTRLLKMNLSLEEDPRCVLRNYFIEGQDAVILKIIFNMLSAIKEVFPVEWGDPKNYILSKSIGYSAFVKSFPDFYRLGMSKSNLSLTFFVEQMHKVKEHMDSKELKFTSEFFSSNEQSKSKLANEIKEAIK